MAQIVVPVVISVRVRVRVTRGGAGCNRLGE